MQKEKLQTKTRNAMGKSFCSLLQQGNNILVLNFTEPFILRHGNSLHQNANIVAYSQITVNQWFNIVEGPDSLL